MVSVTEKTLYLSGFLAGVTAMTVLYGLILDRGEHLYFVDPYFLNLTRRTRRAEQAAPYLCSFEATSGVGFVYCSPNSTPIPDDGPPLSSGYREHRRVPDTEPDDKKSLINVEYSDHRRVCRVL